jgi:hypothetical protein
MWQGQCARSFLQIDEPPKQQQIQRSHLGDEEVTLDESDRRWVGLRA